LVAKNSNTRHDVILEH